MEKETVSNKTESDGGKSVDEAITDCLNTLQQLVLNSDFVPPPSKSHKFFVLLFNTIFAIYYLIASSSYFMEEERGRHLRFLLGDYFYFSGFQGVYEFMALLLTITGMICRAILHRSDLKTLKITYLNPIRESDKETFLQTLRIYIYVCHFAKLLIIFVFVVTLMCLIPANLEYRDLGYFLKSLTMVVYIHVLVFKLLPFLTLLCSYTLITTQFLRYRINRILECIKWFDFTNEKVSTVQMTEIIDDVNTIEVAIMSQNKVLSQTIFGINCLVCPVISITLSAYFMKTSLFLKLIIVPGCTFYIVLITTGSLSAAYIHTKSMECFRKLSSMYVSLDRSVSVCKRNRLRVILSRIAAGKMAFTHGPMGNLSLMTIMVLFGNTVQMTFMSLSYFHQ
jgi:hypothetical protein